MAKHPHTAVDLQCAKVNPTLNKSPVRLLIHSSECYKLTHNFVWVHIEFFFFHFAIAYDLYKQTLGWHSRYVCGAVNTCCMHRAMDTMQQGNNLNVQSSDRQSWRGDARTTHSACFAFVAFEFANDILSHQTVIQVGLDIGVVRGGANNNNRSSTLISHYFPSSDTFWKPQKWACVGLKHGLHLPTRKPGTNFCTFASVFVRSTSIIVYAGKCMPNAWNSCT